MVENKLKEALEGNKKLSKENTHLKEVIDHQKYTHNITYSENQQLKKNIEKLQQEKRQLEGSLELVTTIKNQTLSKYQQLDQQVKNLETNKLSLKDKVDSLEHQNRHYRAEIQVLQDERHQMNSENIKLLETINKMNASRDGIMKDSSQLKKALEENEILRKEICDYSNVNQRRYEENERQKEAINQLNKEVQRLNTRLLDFDKIRESCRKLEEENKNLISDRNYQAAHSVTLDSRCKMYERWLNNIIGTINK